MPFDQFEQELQRRLGDASMAPASNMWEKVEKGLLLEKLKRRAYLIRAGSASMAAAALLVVFLWKTENKETTLEMQAINAGPTLETRSVVDSVSTAPTPTMPDLSMAPNRTVTNSRIPGNTIRIEKDALQSSSKYFQDHSQGTTLALPVSPTNNTITPGEQSKQNANREVVALEYGINNHTELLHPAASYAKLLPEVGLVSTGMPAWVEGPRRPIKKRKMELGIFVMPAYTSYNSSEMLVFNPVSNTNGRADSLNSPVSSRNLDTIYQVVYTHTGINAGLKAKIPISETLSLESGLGVFISGKNSINSRLQYPNIVSPNNEKAEIDKTQFTNFAISIPIWLSYQISQGKSTLVLSAGLLTNIQNQKEIGQDRVIVEDAKFTSGQVQRLESLDLLNKQTVYLQGGIKMALQRNLSENLSLNVGPVVQFGLTPTFESVNNVPVYLHQVGLEVGLAMSR